MIGLYIILGVIAFFNFGFFRYLTDKPKSKITVHDEASQGFDKTIQNPQPEAAKESQGPSSDMETDNWHDELTHFRRSRVESEMALYFLLSMFGLVIA